MSLLRKVAILIILGAQSILSMQSLDEKEIDQTGLESFIQGKKELLKALNVLRTDDNTPSKNIFNIHKQLVSLELDYDSKKIKISPLDKSDEQYTIPLIVTTQSATLNNMLKESSHHDSICINSTIINPKIFNTMHSALMKNYIFIESIKNMNLDNEINRDYKVKFDTDIMQDDSFNELTQLNLTDLILCDNSINALNINPEYKNHPLSLPEVISKEISKQIVEAISPITEATKRDYQELERENIFNISKESITRYVTADTTKIDLTPLQSIENPLTASAISQELIRHHYTDKNLLRPYCEKLINSPATPIILSPNENLYYFTADGSFTISLRSRHPRTMGACQEGDQLRITENGVSYLYPFKLTYFNVNTIMVNNAKNDKSFIFSTLYTAEKRIDTNFIFNGNNKKIIALPSTHTGYGFASDNCLYAGDQNGAIYTCTFDANTTATENIIFNPVATNILIDDPIKGISSDQQYENYCIYTEKKVFIVHKKEGILLLEELPPLKNAYGTEFYEINQSCMDPSGTFISISISHQGNRQNDSIFICNIQTKNIIRRKEIVRGSSHGLDDYDIFNELIQSWKNDGTLLVATDFDPQQRETNYHFVNPYSSGHTWQVRTKPSNNLPTTLYIAPLSADGKQSIEISKNLLTTSTYCRTIIDENLEKTINFLTPTDKSPNKTNQLIAIILLNDIIKNHDSDPDKLDPSLHEHYRTCVPKAVDSVLRKDTGYIPSWYSPLLTSLPSLQDIRNTLYEYRRGLVGAAAAAALGITAYKLLKSKNSQ